MKLNSCKSKNSQTVKAFRITKLNLISFNYKNQSGAITERVSTSLVPNYLENLISVHFVIRILYGSLIFYTSLEK